MKNQEYISAVWQHGAQLEWTTVQQRRGVSEQVAAEQATLELPAESDEAYATVRKEGIGQALGGLKGAWTLVLPSDRVLLRVVDLPSTDPEELAGMAELQVDKFAPFPVEQMAIAHESLWEGEGTSRVLIAACRRETVTEWADRFSVLGRQPDRVDVALACRWHALRAANNVPDKGRQAILVQEAAGIDLLVVQDGLPVIMRPLGSVPAPDDPEAIAEIAEEVSYTLTSLESEWGAVATVALTLWSVEPPADALVTRLEQECALPVQVKSMAQEKSLSAIATERMQDTQHVTLDLALDDWRAAASLRAGQRRIWLWGGGLLLGWLLVLGGLFGISAFEQARVERMREQVAALEGPAEEAHVLRRRIASLEQYADRTYSALEVLREVSSLLPDGVELTSFTYRKAGRVNIRGEASRVPPIYDFFEALEASALFVEVNPEGVTQAPGGRRRPDFRLTAYLPGDES